MDGWNRDGQTKGPGRMDGGNPKGRNLDGRNQDGFRCSSAVLLCLKWILMKMALLIPRFLLSDLPSSRTSLCLVSSSHHWLSLTEQLKLWTREAIFRQFDLKTSPAAAPQLSDL